MVHLEHPYSSLEIVCREKSDLDVNSESKLLSDEEAVIVCRRCANFVTRPIHRISIDNSFSHTFANPSGQVFEIGCFNRAEGCVSVSEPSFEFTWFAGYLWEAGVCTGCASHLGWIFSSRKPGPGMLNRFHGLILDKLIFPS